MVKKMIWDWKCSSNNKILKKEIFIMNFTILSKKNNDSIYLCSLLFITLCFHGCNILKIEHHPANEPPIGTEIVNPVDGAIMVYVPSGFFTMGLSRIEADQIVKELGLESYERMWLWESLPKRREYTNGFFIDKYEVTIERWLRFLKANPGFKKKNDEISQYFDNPIGHVLPVATIFWDEAQQFANWTGKFLPSEKQWEKAARSDDGRFFPWGNKFDQEKGHFDRDKFGGWDKRHIYTRVGKYPSGAAPCGALDMLGNQYELTSGWVEPYPNNPDRQRMIKYTGHKNICLRGGSWYQGKISFFAAKRFGFPMGQMHYHVGFRTVWEPPENYFTSQAYLRDKKAVLQKKRILRKMFSAYDKAEKKAIILEKIKMHNQK